MTHQTDTRRSLGQIADGSKARYTTVEEMVVSAIREAIISGVFVPGERLRQEMLAEALDVSRVPVRGALRKLEAEGLVVSSPHRGSTVRVLEADEIRETYDLRILLETFALQSAIERITPEEVEELSALADEIDGDSEGDDWLTSTEQFYLHLYSIAGQPLTAEIILKLRASVGRYWLSLKVLQHEGSTHRVIIDAIRAGDPVMAEQWLTDHLTKVSKELQRRVKAQSEAATR